MGLLDLFNKKDNTTKTFPQSIQATAEGEIVQMKDIPDPVFSQGMVGPCIGITPSKGTIVAPCTGKLVQLSDTLHAFGIQGDNGAIILVHIGIDTVQMQGDGFTAKAKVNDTVKAGQPIVEVDLEKVAAAGHPSVVMTILTNPNDFTQVDFTTESTIKLGNELIKLNK